MTNARTVQRPVALAIRRKVHPGHGGWGNRPLRAATNCGWEHSRGCYLGESPRITPMATRRRPWPWWLGALARRTPEATFCKFCGFCGEVLERLIAFAIGSFTVLVCPSQIGRTTVLEHPRAPQAFCRSSSPEGPVGPSKRSRTSDRGRRSHEDERRCCSHQRRLRSGATQSTPTTI